ncbi:dTMP kinase [Candidatus Woesearchaeota archaeon]|nr:MAG: dTMP kinase [Candidatus Woesearchaeota archaeon]
MDLFCSIYSDVDKGRRFFHRFITLEGIEGCGKSTQAKLLAASLENEGFNVFLTREPGWGVLGKKIRQLVLHSEQGSIDTVAETLLFMADRAQHVRRGILPALLEGKVVISDRYHDSTVAYQGFGLKSNFPRSNALEACYQWLGCHPGRTYWLDVPVNVALERVYKRSQGLREGDEAPSKFDVAEEAFHRRVREGFLYVARKDPRRVVPVDGAQPVERVHEVLRRDALSYLNA